jgi:hypothetical protein
VPGMSVEDVEKVAGEYIKDSILGQVLEQKAKIAGMQAQIEQAQNPQPDPNAEGGAMGGPQQPPAMLGAA